MVVATAAVPVDGATRTYLHGDPYRAGGRFRADPRAGRRGPSARASSRPSAWSNGRRLLQPRRGLRHEDGGRAASSPSRWRPLRCSTSRSRAQGSGEDVRPRCILTVSDTLAEDETVGADYMSLEDLEAATEAHDRDRAGGGHRPVMSHAARASVDPDRHQPDLDRGHLAVVDGVRRGRPRQAGFAGVWCWDHFVSRGREVGSGARVLDDAHGRRGAHVASSRSAAS